MSNVTKPFELRNAAIPSFCWVWKIAGVQVLTPWRSDPLAALASSSSEMMVDDSLLACGKGGGVAR